MFCFGLPLSITGKTYFAKCTSDPNGSELTTTGNFFPQNIKYLMKKIVPVTNVVQFNSPITKLSYRFRSCSEQNQHKFPDICINHRGLSHRLCQFSTADSDTTQL